MAKPAALGKPRLEHPRGEQTTLKDLLRHSRMTVGVSFREASSISRWIADTLSDELYCAAASTRSDYEALSALPRHIQKIFALCLLYRIGFDQLLPASGFPLGRAGSQPIPDVLIPREPPRGDHGVPSAGQNGVQRTGGFVAALLSQWEEIPLFLRFSLDHITSL